METKSDLTPAAKKTLLVVEDNDMNREILSELLSDDYTVLQAADGLTGLKLMEESYQNLSLILLDIFMPGCNGFDFLARKKEKSIFDSIPVIVMTSSNTVEDEIRCLELGASDFLAKPYNTEVMKNRIRSTIRLRDTSSMLNRLEKDNLTGLYSKEFFYHNCETILHNNTSVPYDLICADVENFRRLNDRYGTKSCDELLQFLSKSLSESIPDLVLGGRVADDTFAFLYEHQPLDWMETLSELNEKLPLPNVNIKYGILKDLDRSLTPTALCDRAIMALNGIKGHYNTTYAIYDEDVHREQERKQILTEGMKQSLERGEFHVYYQPKHDLKDDSIIGAEALVRWIHPELGSISPSDFIPLFEKNGFVASLDAFVWEEVCKEIRHCLDIGFGIVPISVNVSRVDFENPHLADDIIALVDKYQIDHSLFRIEITESICQDDNIYVNDILDKLHASNFVIELDDFGSGYSSLAALTTLNLDVMKLDRSIIRNASERRNYSLVRYAILLAESMKLKTIAEGVETDEQIAALRVLGCDYIQGHYYSYALSKDDFEPYLLEHESSSNDGFMGRFF